MVYFSEYRCSCRDYPDPDRHKMGWRLVISVQVGPSWKVSICALRKAVFVIRFLVVAR